MSFLMPKMPAFPEAPKMPKPSDPPSALIDPSQTAALQRARAKSAMSGAVGNKDIVLSSPYARNLAAVITRNTLVGQ